MGERPKVRILQETESLLGMKMHMHIHSYAAKGGEDLDTPSVAGRREALDPGTRRGTVRRVCGTRRRACGGRCVTRAGVD